MKIAVLGLGNMGSAVAGRLIDGGHEVVVWNRTASRADPLVARGAQAAASIAEAAAGVQAVLISVRDDDAAESVVRELVETGVSVPVVNCTTAAPVRTGLLAELVPTYVAAPILGAPQAVIGGSATYLVAGSRDVLEQLDPMWPSLTSRVLFCGSEQSRASVIKLISNHLLLTGLVALSEAVAVGQAAGLEENMLRGLLAASPMVPEALRNRLDDVISGDHTKGWFATPLGAKDVGLFVELGAAHGVTAPLAALARDRYRATADAGFADVDVAAVVELLRTRP